MVSISKMVKFRYSIIKLLLLCILCQCIYATSGSVKSSSIRIHQEDQGEILLFLINVWIHMLGKTLDKGYKCPVYCATDHKHIYWETYEKTESNIPPDDGLPRRSKPKGGEQSESDIRPIASTN